MKKKVSKHIDVDTTRTIGSKLSFSASEAYKRLRTNMLFSFTDDNQCRIIGVTSALRGEGKSTTSINLAYSMAEMGKQTLIIDGDMRLSNVHKLLGVQLTPGLSNLISGVQTNSAVVQRTAVHNNLYVISAGDTPPNPSELLSSKRMGLLLNKLAESYDYIIIDLPPVDAVSDALVVSNIIDGMVVVVRENYVDKQTLDNCVQQLKYHEANILGFVLNCAEEKNTHYKKRYYKNGKRYGYGYGYRKNQDNGESNADNSGSGGADA